jgi:hypothetical protein
MPRFDQFFRRRLREQIDPKMFQSDQKRVKIPSPAEPSSNCNRIETSRMLLTNRETPLALPAIGIQINGRGRARN